MSTIYKYTIETVPQQNITMPKKARILDIQVQKDQACIWALVDPTQETEEVLITTIGTGHDIQTNPGKYVGTYQIDNGNLVFHVFAEQDFITN